MMTSRGCASCADTYAKYRPPWRVATSPVTGTFQAFDDNWDSIEDLIKARNADSYVAIEKDMIEIEKAFKSEQPDVARVTAMVNEVMRLYNEALAEVVKEARARQ